MKRAETFSNYLGLLFVLLLVFCLAGCETRKKPIQIGFVGGLTGRVAGLGIAGRDGALMAVEEANVNGGIAGRPIFLSVKDDQQDGEVARQVVRDLLQQNVVAIVGHMTSSMTAATLPVVNDAQKVMISPTSKSDLFSGKDDYLFRVTAASSYNAARVAKLAANEMALRRFAVVYDTGNRAFTESWKQHFQRAYEKHGGTILLTRDFQSGAPDLSFYDLAETVLSPRPDAILVLASAIDTALLMQQLKKHDSRIPVFASEWSFTSDLLNYGGKAVEGLISFHSFNTDNTGELYIQHKKAFVQRFGYEPSFASVLSYDATKLLITGLQKDQNPQKLKQTLLSLGRFAGLQSDIELDKNGDVTRKLFHTVIADGHFKIVD